MAKVVEILQNLKSDQPSRQTFNVGEDWGQGRAIYGGMVAMLATKVMRDVGGAVGPLRSLQVTFAGPVLVGDVVVEAELVRQGKSVTVVSAKVGDGQVAGAHIIGCFGNLRETSAQFPAPQVAANTEVPTMQLPFLPGITPNFTQHCRMRFVDNGFPFQNRPAPETQVFVDWPEIGDLDDELYLVLASDTIPPPILTTLKKPSPASSLTWMMEVVGTIPNVKNQWLRFDARADHSEQGYSHSQANIYAEDGRLLSINRQVVSYFG